MGRRKRKFIDKRNPSTRTYHVVHRSQRDPLINDDEAPTMVLKQVLNTSNLNTISDYAPSSVPGGVYGADGRRVQMEWGMEEIPSNLVYGDDDSDLGSAGSDDARRLVRRGGKAPAVVGQFDDPDEDESGDARESATAGLADRERERARYEAYAMLGVGNDGYDYSQHLREGGRPGGIFISASGNVMPSEVNKGGRELAVIDMDTATRSLPPDNPYGLPEDVLPSAVEEDIGMLDLAAPVYGKTVEMPEDVVEALEKGEVSDEAGELDDDFILLANAEPDDDDGDDWRQQYLALYMAAGKEEWMTNRPGVSFQDGVQPGMFSGLVDRFSGPAMGTPGMFDDPDGEYNPELFDQGRDPELYRDGMAGAFDEKFDLMLETEYGDDEIGELEPGQEGQTVGTTDVNDLGFLMEDFLKKRAMEHLNMDTALTADDAEREVALRFALEVNQELLEDESDSGVGGGSSSGNDGAGDGDADEDGSGGSGATRARREQQAIERRTKREADEADLTEKRRAAAAKEEFAYVEMREKLPFDSQSIISTYSTHENHPGVIRAPVKKKKNKIAISKKSGIPLGVLESRRKPQDPEDDYYSDDESYAVGPRVTQGRRGETKAERKERKRLLKAERAQRRAEKKALKQAFRNEEARQAKQLTANRMNKLSTVKY